MRGFSQLVLSVCVVVSMFWPFSRSKMFWSIGLVVHYAAILSLGASLASNIPAWTTLFAIGTSMGTACYQAALIEAAGKRIRHRTLLLAPMICLTTGIAAYWQFDLAIFVLYAVNAVQFLSMAFAAYAVGPERGRIGGRLLLALGCVVASGATLFLAVHNLLRPDAFVLSYGVLALGTAMAMIMQNLGWLALQKDTAEIQLERLAHVDGLTGLLNRRGFAAETRRLQRTARRTGKPISVLLIDIDHFKLVNDRWGHDTGDHVLAAVGALLDREMRGGDLCCRLGGEEFVVILQDALPMSANLVADRLRAAMADEILLPDGSPVQFSAGISLVEPTETGFDAAIARADRALYEAKASGRDCTVIGAEPQRLAA